MRGNGFIDRFAVPATALEPDSFTAQRVGGDDVLAEGVAYDYTVGSGAACGLNAQAIDGGVGLADAHLGTLDNGLEILQAVVAEDGPHVAVEIADEDEGIVRGAVLEDAAGGLEVAQDVAIAIVGDGRNDFGLLRVFGLPLACLGEVLEFEAHLLAEDGEHRIVWLDNGLRAEGTLAEDIGRAEVFPTHCRQFAG